MTPGAEVSGTRAVRRIAADPTSVALMVADPATVALWPGLERIDADSDGAWAVRVHGVDVRLHVGPPLRTPTAYLVGFGVAGPRGHTRGRLRLAAEDRGAARETLATVDVDGPGSVVADACGFLERLGDAAARRSRAA